MSLAGMLFFLWQLPAILLQANFQRIAPLWSSLGWGWYLSMLGTALTLLGASMPPLLDRFGFGKATPKSLRRPETLL